MSGHFLVEEIPAGGGSTDLCSEPPQLPGAAPLGALTLHQPPSKGICVGLTILPQGLTTSTSWQPQLHAGCVLGCTEQGMLWHREHRNAAELPHSPHFTSGCLQHNLKPLQIPTGQSRVRASHKRLHTNRASTSRASTGPQGSTAASPHLQPSWKRNKLIYFTDCLQLKTPHYRNFRNTLQTIISFISIMTAPCQML